MEFEVVRPAAPWRVAYFGACMIRLAACALAVGFVSALPAYAYSTYSLATIQSNGNVVGTAVTDGTPPPGTNMRHTAYATATLTSPKGRRSVNNGQGTNTYTAETILPFDPTDLGTFEEDGIHSAYCPCMGTFINNAGSSASTPLLSLTCGGAVARGVTAICALSGLGSGTVTGWKFTDGTTGGVTVTSSSSATTWSGTAVRSGMVSVSVTGFSSPATPSTGLIVNARSGWAFATAAPNQVSPQTLICNNSVVILPSPPSSGSLEGYSCVNQGSTYNSQTISGGPNSGYTYITSATNTTSYQWEIVPDLTNTTSQFYQAQCGDYKAQSNPNGFISGANLAAQTQRHEIGSIQGHWGEYNNAQNNLGNNVGLVYEGLIAVPGASIGFVVSQSSISTDQSNISTAEKVEPYPINYDQNGAFLGNVNFVPYQKCP